MSKIRAVLSSHSVQKKSFDRNSAMADPPSDKKRPQKTIVTEGDRKNNIINALSDLGLVTAELTSSISHLKEFVGAEVEKRGGENFDPEANQAC